MVSENFFSTFIIFCKQLFLVFPHISSCFLLCCSQNYHCFTSSRSNSYPGFHLFALQVSQHDSFGLPLLISAECVSCRQRRPPGDPGSTRLSAWLEPLWRRQLLKAHSRGAAQQGLCEISREWVQLGRGGLRIRGRLRALMCHCLLFSAPAPKEKPAGSNESLIMGLNSFPGTVNALYHSYISTLYKFGIGSLIFSENIQQKVCSSSHRFYFILFMHFILQYKVKIFRPHTRFFRLLGVVSFFNHKYFPHPLWFIFIFIFSSHRGYIQLYSQVFQACEQTHF